MASRKRTKESSPEAKAANAAGEVRREKEKVERIRNNEKQKRFRESMKADGYKQVLLWTVPAPADVRDRMTAAGFRQCPAWEKPGSNGQAVDKADPGRVKIAAAIRESSIGAADKAPEIKAALYRAMSEFLNALGMNATSPEVQAVYRDYLELLKPLGDPWRGLA